MEFRMPLSDPFFSGSFFSSRGWVCCRERSERGKRRFTVFHHTCALVCGLNFSGFWKPVESGLARDTKGYEGHLGIECN